MADALQPIVEFLNRFTAALGMKTAIDVEQTPDGPRLNLSGEEAELLARHRGEPIKALQHVVDMSFARTLPDDKRVFVDALEYRKGKDVELRKMAVFLAQKAKDTGLDQQLGPLNPYGPPERVRIQLPSLAFSSVTELPVTLVTQMRPSAATMPAALLKPYRASERVRIQLPSLAFTSITALPFTTQMCVPSEVIAPGPLNPYWP